MKISIEEVKNISDMVPKPVIIEEQC